MNVNAKPLSELSRIVQCLEVASTPFKTAPQKLISTVNNDDDDVKDYIYRDKHPLYLNFERLDSRMLFSKETNRCRLKHMQASIAPCRII